MPIKLEIKSGPPFKKLLSYGSILSDTSWELTFQFLHPEKGLSEKAIAIEVLGCPRGAFSSEDDYCFIGFGTGGLGDKYGSEPFYFVGQYSIRTRTGKCEMMTPAEFFASPVACLLYSNASRRFKKHEAASKAGTYRVVKVAVRCSRTHESMFLDIVSQTDKATLSNVGDADIIVTDERTSELMVQAPNKAHFAFYAVSVSPLRKNETVLNSHPEIAQSELIRLIEQASKM